MVLDAERYAPHTLEQSRSRGAIASEAERRAVSQYRREDVLRILRLPHRQLNAWERAGLISASEHYSFDELVQLRKLRELAETRISVKSIRQSVDAMQKVAGLSNPLLELAVVRRGSRLAFRQGGALVDPMTRQMAFDFELMRGAGLAVVRRAAADASPAAAEVQEMFLRAVRLEESATTLTEAKVLYCADPRDRAEACAGGDQSGDDSLQRARLLWGRVAVPAGDDRGPGVCARVL